MIEQALRTEILKEVSYPVYIGDVPFNYTYPFIKITSPEESYDNPELAERMYEIIKIEIFAKHETTQNLFGYPTLSNITATLRERFDGFRPESWTDSSNIFDVQNVVFLGQPYQKNADVFEMVKPILLKLTYNFKEKLPQ